MSLEPLMEKIATLPTSPGVYLMKDQRGEVLYVGKAKSLRERVRSYFSGSDTRAFVSGLAEWLTDIEVILTHTDKEALLVENDFIKRYRPRFNIKLIDDKNFLCLRLNTQQAYPRLEVTRKLTQDKGKGVKIFGPYHSATAIRHTLRLINRHFQLRTCSDQFMAGRKRPCLQYQIKRCPAPCVFDLSHGEYGANVAHVVDFLEGRQDTLLRSLRARMGEKSAAMEYEAAALVRDQIRAVEQSIERQRVVTPDLIDRDVVGYYREGPAFEIHIMRMRRGRVADARRFSFDQMELPTSDVLADFACRYYAGDVLEQASGLSDDDRIPHEVLFPDDMEWSEALQAVLADRKGRSIRVLVPKRGGKRRLVELAQRNAHQAFVDKQRTQHAADDAITRLQKALHLTQRPERIECVDISHFQGTQIVGSVVRFDKGLPNKRMYRHYGIRSTGGQQDDFQSMYEVLSRRARRGLEDGDLPDLIVIDGGKGQLGAAQAAFTDHGIDTITLIGLAKSRLEQENVRSPERVFLVGQKNPIVLPQNSAELFLLTRARDEAHRFAITFHRKNRTRATLHSQLDQIPGIGPKRRKALLTAFGSTEKIKEASRDALAKVVGEKLADHIITHLQQSR